MALQKEIRVANCPQCGHVYQKNISNLCQSCISERQEQLAACHRFLRSNRKATIAELSGNTAISSKQIFAFLKEGRLILSDYPNLSYPCDSCGAGIRSHKLCSSCSLRLSKEIRKLQHSDRSKELASSNTRIGFQIGDRLTK